MRVTMSEVGGNGEGGILPWTSTPSVGVPAKQQETIKVPVSKGSDSNSIKRTHRCRKLLYELLQEFAKNTGLHGPRYTTLQGLTTVEKIFWTVAFLLSLILCIILILGVWEKWKNSSTIVTFSEHHMHIWEVPFPAVTICPKAKIDQQAYNYTENTAVFGNITYDSLWISPIKPWMNGIISHDSHLGSFGAPPPGLKIIRDYKTLQKIKLICNELAATGRPDWSPGTYDIMDIVEAAPKLNQIFLNGSWQNELLNITQGDFTEVLMEEGVCFTFNSLAASEILNMESVQQIYSYSNASKPSEEWDLETGYSNIPMGVSYPRRGRPRSDVADLKLHLQENITRDKLCNGDVRGFKVYLHHPADLPQSSMFYYTVLPDYDNSISIVVDVLKPSIELSKCPLHIRKCYIAGEKVLKYFKLYSQNNCRLECLTNYTEELCGCVWFHMPIQATDEVKSNIRARGVGYEAILYHFRNTLQITIQSYHIWRSLKLAVHFYHQIDNQCTYLHKYCIKRVLELLLSVESAGNINGKMYSCGCLPSCFSVQYRADVYKNSIPRNETTFIEMYFRDSSFISRTRECSGMFELMDFLAYCGGLLGLFLGFSFLSLVEIFYFCTLRLFCIFRRDNQGKKKKDKRTKQKRTKKF